MPHQLHPMIQSRQINSEGETLIFHIKTNFSNLMNTLQTILPAGSTNDNIIENLRDVCMKSVRLVCETERYQKDRLDKPLEKTVKKEISPSEDKTDKNYNPKKIEITVDNACEDADKTVSFNVGFPEFLFINSSLSRLKDATNNPFTFNFRFHKKIIFENLSHELMLKFAKIEFYLMYLKEEIRVDIVNLLSKVSKDNLDNFTSQIIYICERFRKDLFGLGDLLMNLNSLIFLYEIERE